jgi:hypothetical protein
MKLGKAFAKKNGYSIHELFVLDVDGNYISAGYGVISPEGELMQSFPTLEAAQDYLDEIASQPLPGSPQKTKKIVR